LFEAVWHFMWRYLINLHPRVIEIN
jgi:hypothetical protein